MIKGVVFDLDHTLFDRYATLTEIAPLYYELLKKHISPGLGIEDVALSLIYADKKYISYGFAKIAAYLNESGFFRIPVSAEEHTEAILHCFTQAAVPFPFTTDVLTSIRESGYKTGLITNGRPPVQYAKLKLLGISGLFDEILVAGEVGISKPDTAIFDMMSEKLGIPAKQLLYVGDNPVNDVDASRRSGYIPVWVRTYEWQRPEIEQCQLQINTVAELPELLKKIN